MKENLHKSVTVCNIKKSGIILMKKKKEENKESIKMLHERISIIDQDIKAMTTNLQNQLKSLKDEVTENDVRENEEGKGQVKCKYFNSGFCRMQENCIFSHKSLKICDAHKNGIKCRDNSCNERHPKVCRYFVRGSCFRNESCLYFHNHLERL